jgi:hypothetical protein
MAEGVGLLVQLDGKSDRKKMRITLNPTFDIETGELISHDGQYEYGGKCEFLKGGTAQAQQNINTANNENSTLFNQGQQEQAQILPFLQQEMTNPQGLGASGRNELLTSGGEATSGALANAKEEANLRASRTGNTASTASIIDAATRAGAQQQSTNALDVGKADLQTKLAQQQAGEQGIASLSGGNIGESLSALGLSNQAVDDYIKAYSANNPLTTISNAIGAVGKGVGAAATGILG